MKEKTTGYLSGKDYRFVFERTPRLCVDLIIMVEGKILLTKRKIPPYKNLWHFPGGRLLYKESITTALKRIIKDELGIEITVKKPRLIDNIEFPNDGEYVHSVSMIYLVEINNEIATKIKIDGQASEFKFFNKLPSKMHPVHRKFVENLPH